MPTDPTTFTQAIQEGYTFKGPSLLVGGAMLDGQTQTGTHVRIPLKTLSRHGLIAGATGTGKTKSLQAIAEGLSENGIGVLMMDIKGDLSGLAKPSAGHPKIDERQAAIGAPWSASEYPVELMTLKADAPGVRLRATVSEFGPVLLGKILNASDAQAGVLSICFKFCDERDLPLVDLKDLRRALQFIANERKEEVEAEYGLVSKQSAAAMLRAVTSLEEQGANDFFGEPSFSVEDLTDIDENGRGIIHILRLVEMQRNPQLFSTFMLCLLAEVFETFPEAGDLDQPKLVIFIDEAHLIFREANKALLDQLEITVKLIRSKGVGLIFCTQSPEDIPNEVLGQLGLKVQHALRAFTASDRKAIKRASENFPLSDFYEIDELMTQMGTGEAFVTALNEKGIPTPLVHTMMCAPRSRMDILTDEEIKELMKNSELAETYNKDIDRESAYEILGKKIEQIREEQEKEKEAKKPASRSSSRGSGKSVWKEIERSPVTKTIVGELSRGLFDVLGVPRGRSRKRSKGLFGF